MTDEEVLLALAKDCRDRNDGPLPPTQAHAVLAVIEERDRMRDILNRLGFCPVDGEPMPCLTCGAGL